MLQFRKLCLLGLVFVLIVKSASGKGGTQKYVDSDEGDHSDLKRISNDASADKATPIIAIEPNHPLDPLSSFELRLAASIVKLYDGSSEWQFKFIGLREPDKAAMYPYYLSNTDPPAGLIPRRANVLITDPVLRVPIWVVVNLSTFQVESWTESPGEKIAVITVEDNNLAAEIAMADPSVIKRINALGYNDLSSVVPDVWDAGYVADNPNYNQARKLTQVFFYGMKGNGTNFYAHPFDFVVYVELGANVIRGIENLPIHQGFDTSDRSGNSIPQAEANFFPGQLPPNTIRRDLHRLKISQPDGPSFKINGREVTWQNFKLRIGYNPREGAHIYTVTYNDHGHIRPVAYRMSLSEVFLQYADPRPPLYRKSSFDLSNGEFGSSLFSLPVHQFCRGDAYYFAADHHNEAGKTWIVQNSICVVEEDDGILWAYRDSNTGDLAATRSQRLAISYLVSIGNTQYFISWRFYADATIELSIKVTGILSTNLMAVDVKAAPYGTLVAPQVYSEIYHHFFAARIDADVDGLDNTVSIEDIVRVSDNLSAANPYGNGLTIDKTVLRTAGESPSDILPTRSWKISNPNNVQYLNGQPVSWKLIPQGPNPSVPNLLTPDSPIRGRIPWADHNMWVTPYDPDQIFIGGKYLSDGVAAWTQQNASASIEDTDVVLWHVFNYVHAPEIEDWPMLSACPGISGFRLRPSGFFNENPAISVPPASETTALDGSGVGVSPDSGSGWGSNPSGGWPSS